MSTTRVRRPSKETIGQLAENQPQLLNVLVAYFVFEWRSVQVSRPPHGVDQTGKTCHIPNYVLMWTDEHRNGVDVAVGLLLQCPETRNPTDPGLLSEVLAEWSE